MTLKNLESPMGAEIVLDGRRCINFAGSCYLGLSGKPEVVQAGVDALRKTGAGYQLSRHFGFATRPHQAVEQEASSFFGSQSALFLAVGYLLGLVTLAAIRDEFQSIFFDSLAHHCLREAIAACGLPSHAFRHLDAEDLSAKLSQHLQPGERPLIVTDGMYSTFGEIAPLDALARAMEPYEGRLLVDESHSFGVLGPTGRGAAEHHGILKSILIGGSLSKAFGCSGGIIPACETEVAAFRSSPASRSASAGSPAAAAMCAASLRYARQHPEILQRLRVNVSQLKTGLRAIGLDVPDTPAPVAAFALGSHEAMHSLQRRLLDEGIVILHSDYIGAPPGGVIRCGIFADHTAEHISRLLGALRRLI